MKEVEISESPLDKAVKVEDASPAAETEVSANGATVSEAIGNEEGGRETDKDSRIAELSSEELASLKDKAGKADEYYDRLLRQTADFDNYKKRVTRERQEASRYALQPLLEKLLPVVDNFEMALAATVSTDAQNASLASLRTGVAMIHSQLKNVLAEAGLEEINAVGQHFDPTWHEAVSHQETSEAAEGTVLQQTRRGYKLKDRLVRPASVIVAKAPGA